MGSHWDKRNKEAERWNLQRPLILDVWQTRGRLVKFIVEDVWSFVPKLYRGVTEEEMPP